MLPYATLIRRDMRLVFRRGAGALTAVFFFVLAVALFPLAVGPEPEILRQVSGGIIWVAALLAALLTLEPLYMEDYVDGSLDLLSLTPLDGNAIAVCKMLAHWLVTGLPLTLVSPVLAGMLHMPSAAVPVLVLSLLLGTLAVSALGMLGTVLILNAVRGGVLLALLVLPLCIPALIFGASAVEAAAAGLPARPHLLLLTAFTVVVVPLSPFISAVVLRQALK